MNTQQNNDFEVYLSNEPINKYLAEKLISLAEYVSTPDENNNFFVRLSSYELSGETAQKFICLANVFGYRINFTCLENVIVYFFKKS